MLPTPHTYRSAHLLIGQHGDKAAIHAAMRADELLEAGDMDGRAIWRRIIKAIEEGQAESMALILGQFSMPRDFRSSL